MSTQSPEIHRGHIYIWGRKNERNYIMRALTERLNFDRLQYLRKQNEQD